MEEIKIDNIFDKMKSLSEKSNVAKIETTNGNVSESEKNDLKEPAKSKNSSVSDEINGSSDSHSSSPVGNIPDNGHSEVAKSKENGFSNSDDAIAALMAAASTVAPTATIESPNIPADSPESETKESVETLNDHDSNTEKKYSKIDTEDIDSSDSVNDMENDDTEGKDDSTKLVENTEPEKDKSSSIGEDNKAKNFVEDEKIEIDTKDEPADKSPPDENPRKRKLEEPVEALEAKKPATAVNFDSKNVDASSKSSAKQASEDCPKVTVIELGNSTLKLSEILKQDKTPNDNSSSQLPNNATITISSTKNTPRILTKVPTNRTAQSILVNKSNVPSSEMSLNSAPQSLQSKIASQIITNSVSKTHLIQQQPMSIAKILANKNVPCAENTLNPTVNLPQRDNVSNVPTVEVIDEKEEYDMLEWEDPNMSPIIRPGRFLPPSPNETMSIAMCNERLIECASKVTPFLLRYPVIPKVEGYVFKKRSVEPNPAQLPKPDAISIIDQSYFKNSLGSFFMEIGQRMVSEWVQKDLVRSRKRKMEKEGETEASVKSLKAMTNMYEQLKTINAPFHFPLRKCNKCKFKTESEIIMNCHLQTPHIFPGTYKYSCTYCNYDSRDATVISLHMKMYHNITAIVDPIPFFHHCVLCLYNTDKKKRLYSHTAKCSKNFKLQRNLAPTTDYSYPAKSYPPTWMHGPGFQRSISSIAMKGARFAAPVMRLQGVPASGYRPIQPINQPRRPTVPSILNRPLIGNAPKPLTPVSIQDPKNKLYQLVNNKGSIISPSLRHQKPVMLSQNVGSKVQSPYNNKPPITIIKNNSPATNRLPPAQTSKSVSQKPSITLTPVNPSQSNSAKIKGTTRLTRNGLQSITVPFKGGKGSHTFVICEICDGYIRDLEQLRAHMQWMHKVKIHPKMIHNRPPLNCQKCQYRFFTDQGLERHLLGIHGLVTSNMQESANKGQDSGRCSACGKTFQSKLLLHIAKAHRISLKPAHLSYKCTVCAATFTLYKLFENHVYSKHTVQGSTKVATSSAPVPKPTPPAPVVKPGPACSKKLALSPANGTRLTPVPKPVKTLPTCPKCEETVESIERHWADSHQRPFSVKLCHIEQCHKCLSDFDGFVVIHTEYFESDED